MPVDGVEPATARWLAAAINANPCRLGPLPRQLGEAHVKVASNVYSQGSRLLGTFIDLVRGNAFSTNTPRPSSSGSVLKP